MITLTYILAGVILLGLCIFIHELGHLLGGKMVGIKAEVFSMGYGKGIIKKKIGDTTYQIAPIPFGGYCKFYGENPSEKREGKEYEFLSASPMRRVLVVLMGPLFNLFFGVFLFFVMSLVGYGIETNRILIPEGLKSGDYVSSAYSAGMDTGDRIIEINGNKVISFSDIQSNVLFSEGKELKVKVERGSDTLDFIVKPVKYSEKDFYQLGVMPYGENILIGKVIKDDIADKAGIREGDIIKLINGKPVKSVNEYVNIIRENPDKELIFKIIRAGEEMELKIIPRLREILSIQQFEDSRFKGENYDIAVDRIALVRDAIKNSRLKINNITITSFEHFKRILNEHKGEIISLTNSGGTYYGKINYEKYGFIGVETMISPEMVHVQYGLLEAAGRAVMEPFSFLVMNFKGIGMMFSGKLDVRQNVSGPIRIVKIAGDVAYYKGISAFILLMANISVILMVMNLLPLPIVDGGMILFFLYEAIRGKPINQKVMEKIQYVGMAILITLVFFVFFNDLSFLPFFQKLFN